MEHEPNVDRTKGSRHPSFPSIIYPVAYGFLAGTEAIDGGGVDVWLGQQAVDDMEQDSTAPLHVDAIVATVDLSKRDAELKLLIQCSDAEVDAIMDLVNDRATFKGLLVRRRPSEVTEVQG